MASKPASMSIKSKKDILLLYSKENGAEAWVTYILQCFNEIKSDLEIQTADIDASLNDVSSLCSEAEIVCLVVSAAVIETMIEQEELLRPCLEKHVVSVIKLFLEDGQFETDLAPQYSVDTWKCYDFHADDHDKNKTVAGNIVDIMKETKKQNEVVQTDKSGTALDFKASFSNELAKKLTKRQKNDSSGGISPDNDDTDKGTQESPAPDPVQSPTPTPSPTTSTATAHKPGSDKAPKTTVRHKVKRKISPNSSKTVPMLYPDCIHKAKQEVVIVFRTEIAESRVIQVEIENKICDTNRLNPYCYSFKAPAHEEGRTKVYVNIDGQKAFKQHLIYMPPERAAYTCPQYLKDLFGKRDLEQLDETLANMFVQSIPDDGSLQCMLTPKNIHEMQDPAIKVQLPTLLHFACHYGLQHLCSSITDMPGSDFALQIVNSDNKTPLDLARDGGFEDMVRFLENFQEMQNYVGNLMEMYTKMGGTMDLSPVGYMSMVGGADIVLDAYDIGGRSRDLVRETCYDEGRIGGAEEDYVKPEPEEDPYEIKMPKPGGVEEVLPDDDAHEPNLPDYEDVEKYRPPSTFDVPTTRAPLPPARSPIAKQSVMTQQAAQQDPPPVPPHGQVQPEPPPVTDPFKEIVKPKKSLGSESLDELAEIQEGFKAGNFGLEDMEALFRAWQMRHKNCPSRSMKEKQKALQDLRNQHMDVLEKKKPGFIQRFTQKKQKNPVAALDIQHNVIPNQYGSLPRSLNVTPNQYGGPLPGVSHMTATQYNSLPRSSNQYGPLPGPFQNRWHSNRDSTASTISTSSTSSYSSSGSRRSNISEDFIEEEQEVGESAPKPPPRPPNTLKDTRSLQPPPRPTPKSASRLPTPPPYSKSKPPSGPPRPPRK